MKPRSKEALVGRIADVLRRSDVDDAEQLIAELERELGINLAPDGGAVDDQPPIATAPTGAKPSDISDEEFRIVSEHARSEWPDDFQMQLATTTTEFEAIRALRRGKPKDIEDTEFQIVRSAAAEARRSCAG